jgi:hypothetical protein
MNGNDYGVYAIRPIPVVDRVLNQLIKGFCLIMQGAILLDKGNKKSPATSEEQKQARASFGR